MTIHLKLTLYLPNELRSLIQEGQLITICYKNEIKKLK